MTFDSRGATPATPVAPSRLRRMVGYFDPAEAGFVRRMLRVALVLIGLALCGLCSVALYWTQTATGRYWTTVLWLESENNLRAEQSAEALVRDYPDRSFQYYRLWAATLRRNGKREAQLAVYDEAARRFPDNWQAQSDRCWFRTLFAEARDVLDACDAALALTPEDAAPPYSRRAVARAITGDRKGAIADLEAQLEYWDQVGYRGQRYQTRQGWLETMRAGGDPFDAETMEWLRGAYY